ncbi:tetratricopeptide repeat protein [Streptomyces sp.]|uniref:tetratricopeptide repeat protein n=1 Tax=Streptomyces sp. TaxID=1931 RepID=UPI002F41A280
MRELVGHRRIVGASRGERLAAAGAGIQDGAGTGAEPGAVGAARLLVARCHRRLRGPYTGVDTVLTAVLPDAVHRWPDLVEHHRVELLYGMPELENLIGPAPRTLASESPFKQRTRFFGAGMIRCMSQGIVTFLLEYARRARRIGQDVPDLLFEEVHEAEPTAQEFIALLIRRADPEILRVTVASTAGRLDQELESVLAARAGTVECPGSAPGPRPARDAYELVAAYVRGDGTSDDAEELRAYEEALTDRPEEVRRLHDERAEELEAGLAKDDWGLRVGALAYHRERGGDPGGAGRRALLDALKFCVKVGFSAAVVDLGRRGRAVTDPVADQHDFWDFTHQAASACIPIGRLTESMDLYTDLLQRYTDPKVHMMTSYAIAMLHTRFFQPRDHDLALRWQHNAVAIAGILPDPDDRRTFSVFHDNGLALIEMHRGNFARSLELIESGIARLDAELEPDQWQLHRSQLLYNRARLLAGMGRTDEAYTDYSTLIDLDPYYTDYLSERARISRTRGDYDAALADYDRAVTLAPPFPELFYNRGTARADTGDIDGALADFGYVLAMEPDDLDTRLARAELLVGLGELDAAEEDVTEGLALRPGEPRLLCMQGTVHLQRGTLDAAADSLNAALDLDPRYPAALINRAVVHYHRGEFPAAVTDLTTALALTGDDPDILLNRGIAHHAQGHTTLALADFDHALTLPGADLPELALHRERCLSDAAAAR